jgi:hypothetical protein
MTKDIINYEGLYTIDDVGNVFSIRLNKNLALSLNNGYYKCQLSKDGVSKTFRVHFLVAQNFIGERLPGMEIDHIDRVKTNNSVQNLRYVTRSQNASNMPIRGQVKYKGVSYQDRTKNVTQNGITYTYRYIGYFANIRFQKKLIYLGKFKTAEEARDAYLNKFKELYGYEYK